MNQPLEIYDEISFHFMHLIYAFQIDFDKDLNR